MTDEPPQISAPRPITQRVLGLLIELLAGLFWIYALTKIFVFDLDVWILQRIDPGLTWVLDYKFPILLALMAVALIATRSKPLAINILYIAFYPAIILFWKLPFFIWRQKSWLLVFVIFNAAIGVFKSFKRNFILGTTFLVATILIASVNTHFILGVSAIVIFIVLLAAYSFAFLKSIKPSAVFQLYSKIFPLVSHSNIFEFDASLQNLPIAQLTSDQLTLRTKAIQNAVLFNRVCFLISKRLRDYQKSRLNIITSALALVALMIITVIAFSLINFAAFKIDPASYQFVYGPRNFFSFVYYSTGSMFYASNGLAPVTAISQGIQILEFLFAVVLLVIFGSIFLNMRNDRYTADLNEAVRTVEDEGHAMEGMLRTEFKLDSIEAAIEALETAKSELLGFILFMTKGL